MKTVKIDVEKENNSYSSDKIYNSKNSVNGINLGIKVMININPGKIITLDVLMTDSISKIENKILEIEKKNGSLLKLIHAGRQLEAKFTVGDYNIQENATIHAFYVNK